jgi:hypothetical protein
VTGSLLAVGGARRFTANTVRDVDLLRQPLLIKRMPNHREARAEQHGWRALQDHYPTPRLYARLRLPAASWLIYQRWGNPTGPKLLLDLLNQDDQSALTDYMSVLTTAYRSTMLHTARRVAPSHLVTKLYHDRAAPRGRLETYYADRLFEIDGVPIDELSEFTLTINGRARSLNWQATLAWLRTWAADTTPHWSAITQGDPTDVNLAVPFALFDYDTAGRNALCGEFANFCWYTGYLGGYLAPRSNPAAFKASPTTVELVSANAPQVHTATADLDKQRVTIEATWRPCRNRLIANRLYWRDVIDPVWTQLAGPEDINRALRPYLALRILGVYNIADLPCSDRLALLACLAECLADDFDAHALFTQGLT